MKFTPAITHSVLEPATGRGDRSRKILRGMVLSSRASIRVVRTLRSHHLRCMSTIGVMRSPFSTPERDAFRQTIRDFVSENLTPNSDAWDEAGEIPWEYHAKLGELGVWGFGISEEYGGLGFDDAFMRAIYSEELMMCGAGGVWAGLNGRMISVEPISRLANDEIKARALADIVAGRAGSCLGITEPGGGSDVAEMKTTARKDGDSYVLNGSKTYITGGMNASYFVVGARTGDAGLGGISLFFLDRDTPGFDRTPLERKMGWWASDQATLYFNECRVPAAHLMGKENKGFLAIMENFNYERVALIAGCLGMMRICLAESIAWARQRKTFGVPLIQHQVGPCARAESVLGLCVRSHRHAHPAAIR